MFLAVMNPHDKSVSIIAVNRNAMALEWMSMMRMAFTWDSIPSRSLCKDGYGDGMELSCERSVAAVSRLFTIFRSVVMRRSTWEQSRL